MSNKKEIFRTTLKSPRELIFEEITLDLDDLDENQVYAETEVSAVSLGTEYSAYAGHSTLRSTVTYPRLVGYCNVARIVKKGKAVKLFNVDDIIITHQSHQSAFICDAKQILAVVPSEVDNSIASLTYIAHLGLAALQRSEFKPGENVAVLGLGAIGLATLGVAAAMGGNISAIGNDDFRIKIAKLMGANKIFHSEELNLSSKITKATDDVGLDLLVTTANSWDAWRLALEVCRKKSRIAVLGFPGRNEPHPNFNPLDPIYFYHKQLTIYSVGSVSELDVEPTEIRFNLKRNMNWLINLIKQNKLPLDNLITHRFPWRNLEQVYLLADKKDKSLITAVIDWK